MRGADEDCSDSTTLHKPQNSTVLSRLEKQPRLLYIRTYIYLRQDGWAVLNMFHFSISPPHRKEPVGGENDALEIKERKNKTEDTADAITSLPGCLGQKDHDVLLAMRDQARLVSTAIQLLTSPESNCLYTSPSIYHKVCSNEAAEPCDLEKPHAHSQVHILCLVCCLPPCCQITFSYSKSFMKQNIKPVAHLNPLFIKSNQPLKMCMYFNKASKCLQCIWTAFRKNSNAHFYMI